MSEPMKTTRRRVLTAGAVVVGASFLTAGEAAADGYGSGPIGPWQNGSRAISTLDQIRPVLDRDGLYMFGDSIAVQDGYLLAQRLLSRTGDVIAVHNWSGRPTGPAVDALAQWAQAYGMPSRILMATGSNDIFTPPDFAAQVERTMSIAGAARTVFWVNVQVCRTSQAAAVQLADQRNSGWINLQLGRRPEAPSEPACHPLGRVPGRPAVPAHRVPPRRRPHLEAVRSARSQRVDRPGHRSVLSCGTLGA